MSRDLKEISTDVLLKMSITNDNRIKDLIGDKSFEIGRHSDCTYLEDKGDGYFYISTNE